MFVAKACENMLQRSLLNSELNIPQVFLGVKKVEVHQEMQKANLFGCFKYFVERFQEIEEMSNDYHTKFIFLHFWQSTVCVMVGQPI